MQNTTKLFFPFLLVFFEMATYLSNDMYLPALPSMMHELSISYQQAQLALTTWFIGSISVQWILGPVSDRYGRKSVLCIGVLLFVLATLCCALATNIHTLLIARFIQGTGICFIAVPGYASIHESFEQKQAIQILALMGAIAILAPALGPLLGSAILILLNWRWIFGFLVIWSTIAALLIFFWMPETLPLAKRHPLNVRVTLQRYRNIISNKEFLVTLLALGFLFCGFILWIASGPFVVIDQFKNKPYIFGLSQALIFFAFIIASRSVKYVMNWLGIQKMIRCGLYITLVGGLLGLCSAIFFPHFLTGFVIGYIIYAFGEGLVFASLGRLAIDASHEPMGARMAVFSTFISGFATLGTVLVSVFYNKTLLSLTIVLVMLITFAIIFERMRHRISE
jgi:Bcr/CflA subfamily drug resistance transporter